MLDPVPNDLTCLGCAFLVIALPFASWSLVVSTARPVFAVIVLVLIAIYGLEAIRTWHKKRQARWLEAEEEEFEVGMKETGSVRARYDEIVDIYMLQQGGKAPRRNDYIVVLTYGREISFPVEGLRSRGDLVKLFESKTQRVFRYRKNR